MDTSTTGPLSTERLGEIRKRAKKAEVGPWRRRVDRDGYLYVETDQHRGNEICAIICSVNTVPLRELSEPTQHLADMDFIANAREDVPALLAEVDRLREENAKLMTPDYYCEQFRIWERVFLASMDGQRRDDYEDMFSTVRLAIEKSNLLSRLIYGREKLRTEKCPVHHGRWSGCHPEPCEFCSYGCNVTGWVRHDLNDEERARMQKVAEQHAGTDYAV